MERTMSFSDWVNEYKPVEFNEVDDLIGFNEELTKKAKDLIGKYLIRYPENIYPVDHISMVYIEGSQAGIFFWYVVTKKPMTNIDKIIIKEELDAIHKISLYNN